MQTKGHSPDVLTDGDLKRALVCEDFISRSTELKRRGARVAAYAPGWSIAPMIAIFDRRAHQEAEN